MSSRISTFIPVYRESNLLEPLLDHIQADPYEDKETFVIVDEPTQTSIQLAEKFAGKVNFVWNGHRKGKVNVLNEIVQRSSGEILFFLDSDVLIDEKATGFLETIVQEMKNAEIVEVKKDIIRDSFLARIVSYDYLSFNFISYFFSRKLEKCLGLNGAAFAINRETFLELDGFRKVIVEDMDIATRSFMKDVKYKFVEKTGILTKAPPSWGAWFNQRKRWALGNAIWLKENFRDLLHLFCTHPGVLLLSLLFIFPCLPFFLITLLTPDDLWVKAIYVSLLLLSTQATVLLPPSVFTSTSLAIFRNIFLMVGSFSVYSSLFYAFARKMGCAFNPLEFAFFYLIYSPLWLFMMIASVTRVYLKRKQVEINWKI